MSVGIVIDGVGRRFGDLTALEDVTVSVEPGETLTLVGPSGCGKSTLLRIIAGLDTPTAGSVAVDGEPPDAARAAGRIGWVPQAPALLPWRTVAANARVLLDVAGAPAGSANRVGRLLDEVGLGSFADALPHELSGGMQQRVALVRAFALDAPLLLMDEPFAALDEFTRIEMRHLLDQLRRATDATVVFVTHSIEEATFLSDRVAVMSARPGSVHDLVTVDLPHRDATIERDVAFFEMANRLRSSLGAAAG